jgi:hypothetical protein
MNSLVVTYGDKYKALDSHNFCGWLKRLLRNSTRAASMLPGCSHYARPDRYPLSMTGACNHGVKWYNDIHA